MRQSYRGAPSAVVGISVMSVHFFFLDEVLLFSRALAPSASRGLCIVPIKFSNSELLLQAGTTLLLYL